MGEPKTLGEILLEAHKKTVEANDLICDAALLIARCNKHMEKAPMTEAGEAVLAVSELKKIMDSLAKVVRYVGGQKD